MSLFTTPLDLRFLDGKRWQLINEFDFASEVTESIIRIPSGFLTDFASIPRPFWTLLPPTGLYGKAAVVHDWLYQRRDAGTHLVDRGEADRVLREGMEVLGVGRATRLTIYTGIRLGGFITWRRYRHREKDTHGSTTD